MTKKKLKAVVQKNERIAENIFSLTVRAEEEMNVRPGQFVGLYPKSENRLLLRPISICDAAPEESTLRLVYRVSGNGTKEFSEWKAGEEISFLGILGNGYSVEEIAETASGKDGNVLLLGGGIGIPPLLLLAKELSVHTRVTAVLGYKTRETFLTEEFKQYGDVFIATEDGSVGTKGTVLDAVSENRLSHDVICACGPTPMLRAVKAFAKETPCFLSLEERMACGIGACLACVCKTTEEDAHSRVHNARVCVEGPVFSAKEVEI